VLKTPLNHQSANQPAVPGEAGNPNIFSLKHCMLLCEQTQHIPVITWSPLNHHSFAQQLAACTKKT